MSIHNKLSERMKNYEAVTQTKLMRRAPVIIRIDGKSFHSFTKYLNKPWDNIFHRAMSNTMLKLAQNIQNCKFAYTESDEISLFLEDWETLETDAWFDNKIQKLASVSASMATLYFNQEFRKIAEEEIFLWRNSLVPQSVEYQKKIDEYHETLRKCIQNGAMFDARCFNLPKEEVINYFYYRQQDAIRNSINMCGQALFSHKELQGKNTKEVKEMIAAKGFNWDTLFKCQQHGTCCYQTEDGWYLDFTMPILKEKNREFLNAIINCE